MKKSKNTFSLIVEILLYLIMVVQMLYAFFGNTPHEILGIVFFALLVCHVVQKRWWFRSVLRKNAKKPAVRKFADAVTLLLLLTAVVMALSGMGVSRTIFPKVLFLQNPELHRYLATAMLALSVIHGGSNMYIRAKRKKQTLLLTALFTIGAVLIGLALVPYLDRHFKKVEIDYDEKVTGERLPYPEDPDTVVVCFTRVGNTDFEKDVDAVSGASLMMASGRLAGNAELLSEMVSDIAGYPLEKITLTGEKYPSSYGATVTVGGRELREKARPEIEFIDVSPYDQVILVYPLWWGTIPMPVATFLESQDFSGKTIYLLATQGSSGFGSSKRDAEVLAQGAEVIEALSIYCDGVPNARETLYQWLSGLQ